MKKLNEWLSANHKNYNIGYYSILGLAIATMFLPTLPFMHKTVQFLAILIIYVICLFAYVDKYHNPDWHEDDD